MSAESLPAANAIMNGIAFAILLAGFIAVKKKRVQAHKKLMLSAIAVSVLFLMSYATRMALTGTHRFPELGLIRSVYLVVLASHTILAIVNVPLVLYALYLALRGRYPQHVRLVKVAWPIWAYVSLTGVIVYLMLYHLAPALA